MRKRNAMIPEMRRQTRPYVTAGVCRRQKRTKGWMRSQKTITEGIVSNSNNAVTYRIEFIIQSLGFIEMLFSTVFKWKADYVSPGDTISCLHFTPDY
jgi:hypothetical protein